jgi:transposase
MIFRAQICNVVSSGSIYGTKLAIWGTEDFWLIVTPSRVKMSQKFSAPPTRVPADKLVRDIRRATRKHHSAEDKIRIVLEGLRGEESIASLCRCEAIAENLY